MPMGQQCTLAAMKTNCVLDSTSNSTARRLSTAVIPLHSAAVRLYLQYYPTRRKILKSSRRSNRSTKTVRRLEIMNYVERLKDRDLFSQKRRLRGN